MNEKFTFTYTAPTESERKEIERIRQKYVTEDPKEEETVDKLKALDQKVHRLPNILALTLGIVGTLIFGLGLTLILEWDQLIAGVIVSLVGVVPVALSYPLYRRFLQRGKRKYGEEILALSEKLLRE